MDPLTNTRTTKSEDFDFSKHPLFASSDFPTIKKIVVIATIFFTATAICLFGAKLTLFFGSVLWKRISANLTTDGKFETFLLFFTAFPVVCGFPFALKASSIMRDLYQDRYEQKEDILAFINSPTEKRFCLREAGHDWFHSFFSPRIRDLLPHILTHTAFQERLENLIISECHLNNLNTKDRFTDIPEALSRCTHLITLFVQGCPNFRILPNSIGNCTELKFLYLMGCRALETLPESIGQCRALEALNLTSCTNLRGLPASILSLPSTCTIDLTGCNFSEQVMDRLREATAVAGYNGPRFSYSMRPSQRFSSSEPPLEEGLAKVYERAGQQQPTFSTLLRNESETDRLHLKNLRTWLHRLSYAAEGGASSVSSERFKTFYQAITKNLELADTDPNFTPTFWGEVKEGIDTCGDRVTLSVLRLGIARQRLQAQGKSLQELWSVLKQSWALDLLTECAYNKIKTLSFFDEIETYLGYPILLQEKLGLSLDVKEMIYHRCHNLTQADLDFAENRVKSQWKDQEATATYLLEQADWLTALERTYLKDMKEMAALNTTREALSEEEGMAAYQQVQRKRKDLTIKAVFVSQAG